MMHAPSEKPRSSSKKNCRSLLHDDLSLLSKNLKVKVSFHCVVCFFFLRKELLTKGLKFLMEVFHLFPPLDKVAAEAKLCALHVEALSASHFILEQLLVKVVSNEEEEEKGEHGPIVLDVTEGSTESKEASQCQDLEPELDSVPLVTDEMRMVDKQSRLQVLHKLLVLACAMVS